MWRAGRNMRMRLMSAIGYGRVTSMTLRASCGCRLWRSGSYLWRRSGISASAARCCGRRPSILSGWRTVRAGCRRRVERGDLLLTRTGDVVVVEKVENSGILETAYNWRVAEYHTYFVGSEGSEWSVWAHNRYNALQQLGQLGSKARSSLRRALGAVSGWIAHHIIPVSVFQHPLVQAAARWVLR